jgi:hypothetical protein
LVAAFAIQQARAGAEEEEAALRALEVKLARSLVGKTWDEKCTICLGALSKAETGSLKKLPGFVASRIGALRLFFTNTQSTAEPVAYNKTQGYAELGKAWGACARTGVWLHRGCLPLCARAPTVVLC